MRKELLTLVFITILLTPIVLNITPKAITASDVGAQKIYTTSSGNWAGVVYSVYNTSTDAPIEITSVSESVCFGNAEVNYVPDPYGADDIGIWVALSPQPSTNPLIGYCFFQAGFGLIVYSNGSYALNPFVIAITLSGGKIQPIVDYYNTIPIETVNDLVLSMFI
ncbi:hypothetical protein [Sulfurisphaera ohwakuensis]|uniref:Uncharacterized protein n=1 Tax=Sulfurisphaera ohwakuensis TaxID=69656 RepID=A0A650CI30_SULOH|nr:hypothetical protein [Sulfurisphaera ohwakuensis]MBB5253541.1 hypothetical protein [Sulfurisphaera ohwakuensis]QGR17436.1 hypothetical protein D1869_09690 [Sulfurisphaera ohwakuensis]